jgi:hypothetical protein
MRLSVSRTIVGAGLALLFSSAVLAAGRFAKRRKA